MDRGALVPDDVIIGIVKVPPPPAPRGAPRPPPARVTRARVMRATLAHSHPPPPSLLLPLPVSLLYTHSLPGVRAWQDRLAAQDCRENGWLLDGFPRTGAQAPPPPHPPPPLPRT